MGGYDGSIKIDSNINSKGFNKGIGSMTGSLKKLIGVIGVVFSAKAVISFSKECTKLGSDITEVQNVVDVAFKTMSCQVNEFAKTAVDQFGLSQLATKKYMGMFGAMANSFGFSEAAALEMSETLTGLSGDIASFYNTPSDEAFIRLKSIFTGETETLKNLGVVMTQNALDQYALANGYNKTTAKMTEQEKVALRYKFILDQLSLASGDFERTQNSWANQTRLLQLRFEELKSTIGQGLINVLTPVLVTINALLSKLQVLANAFKSVTDLMTGNVNKSSNGMGTLADSTAEATENMTGLGDATKKAGKKADNALASFDQLEVLNNSNSDNSDSGIGSDIGSLTMDNTQIGSEVEISQKLIDKVEELKTLFEPVILAWNNQGQEVINSLSNAFDGLKSIFVEIGDSFAKVWTNGTGQKVLEKILKIIQSIFYTIENIGNAWSNAWNNENNGDKIIQNLANSFNTLLAIVEDCADVIEEYTQSDNYQNMADSMISTYEILASWVQSLTDMIRNLWENGGRDTFENFLEVCGKIGELVNVIVQIADPFIKETLRVVEPVIQGIIKAIDGLLGGMSGAIDYIVGVFTGDWERAWNGIKNIFKSMWQFIEGILDTVTLGMYTKFKEWLTNCWNSIYDSFSAIYEFVSNTWNAIKDAISNVVTTIKDFFVNTFNNVKDKVVEIFNNIKNGILNIIENVKTGVSNKLNVIKDTFVNVFSNIWSNIKGIINNIIGGIEGMVNRCVDGINKLINGVNSVSSAVGIPAIPTMGRVSLPRLATGAVIPPRQEFLAVLGDQKNGVNIETPLKTMVQAFDESLDKRNSRNSGNGNRVVILQPIGNSGFAKYVVKTLKEYFEETGDTLPI